MHSLPSSRYHYHSAISLILTDIKLLHFHRRPGRSIISSELALGRAPWSIAEEHYRYANPAKKQYTIMARFPQPDESPAHLSYIFRIGTIDLQIIDNFSNVSPRF
jgi:hypothetical protein